MRWETQILGASPGTGQCWWRGESRLALVAWRVAWRVTDASAGAGGLAQDTEEFCSGIQPCHQLLQGAFGFHLLLRVTSQRDKGIQKLIEKDVTKNCENRL